MISDREFGELIQSVKTLSENSGRMADNVEKILTCQAATEERLKSGNKKFDEQSKINTEVEIKLNAQALQFAGMPSKAATYSLIVAGFAIVGALITIYKFVD